jgi:hypothetical protein
MERYCASWKSTKPFAIGISLLLTAAFCFLLLARSYWAVLLVLVVLLAGFRLQQMFIAFTSDSFVYQGWFRRFVLPYRDIRSVKRMLNEPWPRNRRYGPLVYEIRSDVTSARINLLWFSTDACKRFYDQFVRRSRSAKSI